MRSSNPTEGASGIAAELIVLLHNDAPVAEFKRLLDAVEILPQTVAGKPALADLAKKGMAVRERLDSQQDRERGLLAVIDSAQDLSSRLQLTDLLRAIVSRARNMLGADVGWLSIHDGDRGGFRVGVAEGAMSIRTSNMVTSRDLGVASIVMSTRLPFTTSDYLNDDRFIHDPVLDDTFRAEGLATLVGVPMLWEGEVLGLLFVADRYHRLHTAQSIAILCTLATHGAVALKNARDFGRMKEALAKADEARAEIERHVRGIQAATDAHEQLTSLLARGASLSAFCETVARLLDASMSILDEAGQVVSQGAAAGHTIPEGDSYSLHGAHGAEMVRALRQSRQLGRSIVAYESGGETCRVMAIIGGADTLGSALLFHRGTLEEISIRTFERSTSIAGIVLLSQGRMEAAKSSGVSALLRSLVAPRQGEAADLADRPARHGIDANAPLCLMLVEIDGPGTAYAARRLRAAEFPSALIDEIDGHLVILCNATRMLDIRNQVCASARVEIGADYRGVHSRPVAGPAEIPALYATLRRAIPVLGRLGVQNHIVGQNELALYSTLFETHDRSSLASFLEATIGPLFAHDRRRGTELAATMLCYFDSSQNANTTAQRLAIHVNTVRQRLATIESLLGHWGQASRALELHMALRLWHLGTPADAEATTPVASPVSSHRRTTPRG